MSKGRRLVRRLCSRCAAVAQPNFGHAAKVRIVVRKMRTGHNVTASKLHNGLEERAAPLSPAHSFQSHIYLVYSSKEIEYGSTTARGRSYFLLDLPFVVVVVVVVVTCQDIDIVE